MTTTDLLRETLAHDAEFAATPDRVAVLRARLLADQDARLRTDAVVIDAGAGRAPRRARPLALGIAAVAAVAVAGLVVTLFVANRQGVGRGPAGVAPAAALPIDTYAFTVGADPGGLEFSYQGTWKGVQGGVWDRPGMTASTSVTAVLDVMSGTGENPAPVRPAGAVDVDVAGTTGWSAPWTPALADLRFGMDPADTLTVWRDDTSGLWVALVTADLDATRIAELAGTVEVADYHPVRVPVRLTWLPPGSVLTQVGSNAGFLDLTFGEHGAQFSLGVGPLGTIGGAGTGTATPQQLDVGGFHGSYVADDPVTLVSNGQVEVAVTNGAVPVAAGTSPAAMPLDTLTRLLAGLTVADLDDPATWTDLDVALP